MHFTIRFSWRVWHSVGRIFLLGRSSSQTRMVPLPGTKGMKVRFLLIQNSSMNPLFTQKPGHYHYTLCEMMTYFPAETNTLSFRLENWTAKQWPALCAEAGLPQMASPVAMFHTTTLKHQRLFNMAHLIRSLTVNHSISHPSTNTSLCGVVKLIIIL